MRQASLERGASRLALAGLFVGLLPLVGSALPSGCLAAPPATLPEVQHAPTILPDEVPPIDEPLLEWPVGGFSAWVQADPGSYFSWAVFFDYDPVACASASVQCGLVEQSSAQAPLDGTPKNVSFTLQPSMMPVDGLCHRIDLIVADEFVPNAPIYPNYHAPSPDGGAGDIVTWWYTGGLGLAACSPYGGPLPEGGYPTPEASSDSPPPVPE